MTEGDANDQRREDLNSNQGSPSKIIELIGVYDADGSIVGELSYWLGARFGVRHCSLCDITHSLFSEKPEWKECQRELEDEQGIQFKAYHRNDQPDGVRTLIGGKYPAVVSLNKADQLKMFMSSSEIGACGTSPEEFMAEIKRRLPSS